MSLPQSPVIVIPARLAATRLPNKPLAEGDFWAYTEYSTNGTVVPGNLVYTQQSSWQ